MRTYENKDELKNEINKSFANMVNLMIGTEHLKIRELMRSIELRQKILLIRLAGQLLLLNGNQTNYSCQNSFG